MTKTIAEKEFKTLRTSETGQKGLIYEKKWCYLMKNDECKKNGVLGGVTVLPDNQQPSWIWDLLLGVRWQSPQLATGLELLEGKVLVG